MKSFILLSDHLLKVGDRLKRNNLLIFDNKSMIPSLHTKKIKGKEGIWEARVDIHNRMTFEIISDTIYLRVVGNHDDVLKNP